MIIKFKIFENNKDIDPFGEEDWNIYGPIENLKYGEDGPKFKCGDRVECKIQKPDIFQGNGTVVDYRKDFSGLYLVCFDEKILNNTGNYYLDAYNIPPGHAFYVREYNMELL